MKLQTICPHAIALAALAVLTLTASGPARADDWPLVRHDPQNSGATNVTMKPPFVKVWAKKGATSEPLLAAGNTLLYTSRRYGGLRDLQAVNAATGKPLWTLKNVTQPGAAAPKDNLLVTVIRTTDKPSSVSKLGANLWNCALAGVNLKTGKVLWQYPIGEHPTYPAISPVTIYGHTAYMVNIPYCVPGEPCGKGSLIALNTKDGSEVARYDWDAVWADQVGTVRGAPMLDNDGSRVAIGLGYQAAPGAYGGQVWIFYADERLKDGPIHRLGDPSLGTGEVSPYAHKGGNIWPLLGGTYLAVQGPLETTRVWDVSHFPADLKWEIHFTRDMAHSLMPGGASPMLLEYNSGAKLLTGMYLSTGKNIWSRTMRVTGLSATAGRTVFVPGQAQHPTKGGATARTDILDGVLTALDTYTGKALWEERRPDVTFNPPIFANGRMYVSDSDGNLTCYASKAKR